MSMLTKIYKNHVLFLFLVLFCNQYITVATKLHLVRKSESTAFLTGCHSRRKSADASKSISKIVSMPLSKCHALALACAHQQGGFNFASKSHSKSFSSLSMLPSTGTSSLMVAINLHGGEQSLLSSTITPTSGLIPALLSSFSSALGLMFWDNNWKGSAFSLNLIKNGIASTFFLSVLSFQKKIIPQIFQRDVIPLLLPLTISAFFGVVIGDSTAIAALRVLGSRRYLLIDCLKPAISVLIGVLTLGEKFNFRSILGVTAIILGVYVASVQKFDETDDDLALAENDENADIALGYIYAVCHLIFDAIGTAITKAFMGGDNHKTNLGPLSIGLLRFGSAAIMLYFIRLSAKLSSLFKATSENTLESSSRWWSFPTTISSTSIDSIDDDDEISLEQYDDDQHYMTRGNWEAIVVGTFFVTFLGPSLFYRSLQFLTLGIGVTLSCTAPLYEPVLARLMRGTKINGKAVLGAIIAFLGVAVLSL